MKITNFEELFLCILSDIYLFEKQLVQELPVFKDKAYSDDLKKTLDNHLNETKEQVKRLDKVFKILKKQPQQVEWSRM